MVGFWFGGELPAGTAGGGFLVIPGDNPPVIQGGVREGSGFIPGKGDVPSDLRGLLLVPKYTS